MKKESGQALVLVVVGFLVVIGLFAVFYGSYINFIMQPILANIPQ